MMTMRNKQVNVDRTDLISQLQLGMAQHREKFLEASTDYKVAVTQWLEDAHKRTLAGDFSKVVCPLKMPVDHSADYEDAIDMLQVSVDSNITLDMESYKAYYKGEWAWANEFNTVFGALKASIAGQVL